jgi:hypothetical protein
MKSLAVTTAILSLYALGTRGVAAQTATMSNDMAGHHTMQGEVTKVDAKKGWVDVKTPEGSMKLHFPPPALENVKKGDNVTVDLAMSTASAGRKKSETK